MTWLLSKAEDVPVVLFLLSVFSPSLQLPSFLLSLQLQLGADAIPAVVRLGTFPIAAGLWLCAYLILALLLLDTYPIFVVLGDGL